MRALSGRVVMAAVLGASGLLAVPARADYPICLPIVGDLAPRRAVVASEASADAAVVDVVRSLGGRSASRYAPLGLRHVELPTQATRDAALGLLSRIPGVRVAEPDVTFSLSKTATDPLVSKQWSIAKMGLPKAWDVETGKSSVVVAVLDTGVDLEHPDLMSKVVPGIDVANGDSDPMDDQMHGTHVAGTIAAATNNRAGVAGVAWGSRVMPVKVLNEKGSGTLCHIAVGILEASDRGAHVINMSLGAPTPCPHLMRLAIERVNHNGVTIVASAGNDALSGAPESAPANCPYVLGVGATDVKDLPGDFSSFGPTVDVSAPGVDIMSTLIKPKTGQHTYGALSGTSMAAPHVAGLAALLKSRNPSWTPAQITDRIIATSVDLGPRGRDDFYGVGRVDAAKALGR